jgi:Zn-dependent protease
VLGIRIGVDPSWFIVLFLVIWSLSGAYDEVLPGSNTSAFLLATASALLFFASVLLHELGHAVVARRNGIPIEGIDLWLFGGLARMRGDSPSAGVEFRMAIAGPLVTLLIAVACTSVGVAIAGREEFENAMLLREDAKVGAPALVLSWLAMVNMLLLVFNLIPGFPLDGGRIVRAIAWWRTGDRVKATRIAAALGRGFAWALIALGVLALVSGDLIGGLWLGFIGFFLNQAAKGAEVQTVIASRLEGLRVSDVMDDEPVAIPADLTLDRAENEFFLRYGWAWFPVVDGAGSLVGVLTKTALDQVAVAERPDRAVREVMGADHAASARVGLDEPLETLLGAEGLQSLGAVLAVDGDGRLKGILTADMLRRALRPSPV